MKCGFTLIEMMIVMAIIVTLISLAVPYYQKSLIRAKESVLRSNLHTLRMAIDEYAFDKQKAPQSLQDLVTESYLHDVPKDPITGSNTTWRLIMEEAGQAVSSSEHGSSTYAAERKRKAWMEPRTRSGDT